MLRSVCWRILLGIALLSIAGCQGEDGSITQSRRCHGDIVQASRVFGWENLQNCASIKQQCSEKPGNCFGIIGWACCM